MPWPSSSPSNVVEVVFCRTKCDKMAVIHQDYYFHHNRKYKGGDYWCCAQRGCKVRLISSSRVDRESGRMEFSRRNKAIGHQHEPNAPNLIEKEFRRQLVNQFDRVTASESGSPQTATAVSVRLVYNQLRLQAIERGVPESLIPSYWNVRSTMYRIRRKRELLHFPTTKSESDRKESNGTSAGEGSAISRYSDPESPNSSTMGEPSTSPVQSEPLDMSPVIRAQEQQLDLIRPHNSSILYQSLQMSGPSSTSPISQRQATQFEVSTMITPIPPIDPDVLRFSSHFFPNYYPHSPTHASALVPTLPYQSPEIFQFYAAMYAEYFRSIFALGSYPRV